MIKIKEVGNGLGYHMKLRSKSHAGQYVVVAVTDAGARCIGAEAGREIFGDMDDYVECPACTYGRKCWRCKQLDEIMGVI